jgi:hypothetical protein
VPPSGVTATQRCEPGNPKKEAKLPSILKAKTHEPELMYDDLRAFGEGGTLEALSSVETGIPIRG